jgi:hypothetical protein
LEIVIERIVVNVIHHIKGGIGVASFRFSLFLDQFRHNYLLETDLEFGENDVDLYPQKYGGLILRN